MLPCRVHGTGSSPGRGAASVLWQKAPLASYVNPRAAELRFPCCRGLTAGVGTCSFPPHHHPIAKTPPGLFYLGYGVSRCGKLKGRTYSAAKATRSSPAPWALRTCRHGKNNQVKVAAPALVCFSPRSHLPAAPGAKWDGDSPSSPLFFGGGISRAHGLIGVRQTRGFVIWEPRRGLGGGTAATFLSAFNLIGI